MIWQNGSYCTAHVLDTSLLLLFDNPCLNSLAFPKINNNHISVYNFLKFIVAILAPPLIFFGHTNKTKDHLRITLHVCQSCLSGHQSCFALAVTTCVSSFRVILFPYIILTVVITVVNQNSTFTNIIGV